MKDLPRSLIMDDFFARLTSRDFGLNISTESSKISLLVVDEPMEWTESSSMSFNTGLEEARLAFLLTSFKYRENFLSLVSSGLRINIRFLAFGRLLVCFERGTSLSSS